MPNRYGENDEPEPREPGYPQHADDQIAYRRSRQDAIDDCQLCDSAGLNNGFACDHIDHAGAAKRGMDMIRNAMGWKQ